MEDDSLKTAILTGFVGLVLIVALLFLLNGLGLLWGRQAAPYAEETRRQTFEQSATYQQGMALDLDALCRERKTTADAGGKAVLAETIRLRSARFKGELPSHIKECVNEVR